MTDRFRPGGAATAARTLPTPLRVLAVSGDDQRHGSVHTLLELLPDTRAEIEHVTSSRHAVTALHGRRHDIVLVDRDADPPGTDGLALAERLVHEVPAVPVIVLSHAVDRAADRQAAEAGIADFLLVPGLSSERLEHAIRYALAHRRTVQRLQYEALHDTLTGLPNRVLFVDRLDQAIRRARRRHPECCAAVLFLDLDRFKVINDSLGHQSGDRLLQALARRLESTLRPNDTVARLSGDEFTLLLGDVGDPHEATVIAERVLQSLREPFIVDRRELFVGASIGIALATAQSAPAEVMHEADAAMYRAKADGKGGHAVFDAEMNEHVMRRLELERGLRRAIEARALDVDYQPIAQSATGRIAGFEALSRWPGGAPAEVLAIAEETGLIVALGRHLLETACAQLAEWRELSHGAGLTIGVNVSARQLVEPDFVPMLRRILRETGLDPSALRLEVSEHDLTRSGAGDATRQVLEQALEYAGVRTHIDDFGAGASPLRLLHRFPGDAIKISRALVAGIGRDAGALEIVRVVVGLAHSVGLEAIAEGVETREQLDHLKVLGCEFAQGPQVSAPLAAQDARELLETATVAGSSQ